MLHAVVQLKLLCNKTETATQKYVETKKVALSSPETREIGKFMGPRPRDYTSMGGKMCCSELTVGHILWPVTHVTRYSTDPWPRVTHHDARPIIDW